MIIFILKLGIVAMWITGLIGAIIIFKEPEMEVYHGKQRQSPKSYNNGNEPE